MAPRASRRLQLYTRGGATYRQCGILVDEVENPRSNDNPSNLRDEKSILWQAPASLS